MKLPILLRALAVKGGVIPTVALGAFVKNPPEKQEVMKKLFGELGISGMGDLPNQLVGIQLRREIRHDDDSSWSGGSFGDEEPA
jgi:hypothetical protein